MTERQAEILGAVVEEYIKTGRPVGSKLLAESHDWGVSSATLRAEMLDLEDEGFLYQPHTSAGRIPTDRGFRYFVDLLMERRRRDLTEKELCALQVELLKLKAQNRLLSRSVAKLLAEMSGNLAVSGAPNRQDFFQAGVGELMAEPEFKNLDSLGRLAEVLDYLEENAQRLFREVEKTDETRILIGRESPLAIAEECSMVVSKCHFDGKEEGLVAIIGPKRMHYSRNVAMIDAVQKILNENLLLGVLVILAPGYF